VIVFCTEVISAAGCVRKNRGDPGSASYTLGGEIMMKTSVFAAATFAFALASAVPNIAAAQGTPGGQTGVGSPQSGGTMPNNQGTTPADRGTTGTRTQADQDRTGDVGQNRNNQSELPSTASPLALLALVGAAAFGGRAVLRRFDR
jgi:hypothetical protein